MAADEPAAAGARLARLIRAPAARGAVAGGSAAEERCDLCARPLAAAHRHVLDVEARRILCACRACALLFDRPGAGGARYRRIPERVRLLEDFRLDDAAWAALAIPVELAFFFASGVAGRVVAFYPGPAGATESLLELDAWREIEAANPVLRELEPDVEALLVNRARGAREHWRVPIDACYALTGVIRTSWRGLGGGEEVWARIEMFFRELRRRAGLAAPQPREEEA